MQGSRNSRDCFFSQADIAKNRGGAASSGAARGWHAVNSINETGFSSHSLSEAPKTRTVLEIRFDVFIALWHRRGALPHLPHPQTTNMNTPRLFSVLAAALSLTLGAIASPEDDAKEAIIDAVAHRCTVKRGTAGCAAPPAPTLAHASDGKHHRRPRLAHLACFAAPPMSVSTLFAGMASWRFM